MNVDSITLIIWSRSIWWEIFGFIILKSLTFDRRLWYTGNSELSLRHFWDLYWCFFFIGKEGDLIKSLHVRPSVPHWYLREISEFGIEVSTVFCGLLTGPLHVPGPGDRVRRLLRDVSWENLWGRIVQKWIPSWSELYRGTVRAADLHYPSSDPLWGFQKLIKHTAPDLGGVCARGCVGCESSAVVVLCRSWIWARMWLEPRSWRRGAQHPNYSLLL